MYINWQSLIHLGKAILIFTNWFKHGQIITDTLLQCSEIV